MDIQPSASFQFVIDGQPVSVFLLVDGSGVFASLKGFDPWHPYTASDLADIANMFSRVSAEASLLASGQKGGSSVEYAIDKADLPVLCPSCGWEGVLSQTDDSDVLGPDFELLRRVCVCPKCGAEVDSSR